MLLKEWYPNVISKKDPSIIDISKDDVITMNFSSFDALLAWASNNNLYVMIIPNNHIYYVDNRPFVSR